MNTALIDGDLLAYRVAARNEQTVEFDDNVQATMNKDQAVSDLKATVAKIVAACGADQAIVCLSSRDKVYWRHAILPSYKSNRSGGRPPVGLNTIKDVIEEGAGGKHYLRLGLEADDCLGILATDPDIVSGTKVICSSDKDFHQVPVAKYDFTTGTHHPCPTVAEADRYHLFQTLVGDRTDGYCGCPGWGPETANKLLNLAPVWSSVIAAYASKGLNTDAALVQARVARILRTEDYDFDKKEPILWTPK